MNRDTLQSFGQLGSDKLSKSLKKIGDNVSKIEALVSKDVLAQINKSVPKGTKVSDFDAKKLESELKGTKDAKASAKKYNIDTKFLDLLG